MFSPQALTNQSHDGNREEESIRKVPVIRPTLNFSVITHFVGRINHKIDEFKQIRLNTIRKSKSKMNHLNSTYES